MGKSLNDNPFNSLGGFNINGIGISQEAIEENKKALGQTTNNEDIKTFSNEDINEIINKGKPKKDDKSNIEDFVNKSIKDSLGNIKGVSEEEKTLIKDLFKSDKKDLDAMREELEEKLEIAKSYEDKKPSTTISDTTTKERTTKKTYIIKDEYIEIIEGLALLKQEQIKDIVNEVIKRGLDSIEELHEGILEKAKKTYKNKDKKDKTIF